MLRPRNTAANNAYREKKGADDGLSSVYLLTVDSFGKFGEKLREAS
jgi:hypothetical protein